MLILDKQRYWSFFKAYVICYVSLVGLYVVIDAFSNLDEFSKRADGAAEIVQIMSRYYLIHQSAYFDQLCGVIGMMAAIFTVTWMQRNNEQLAILAAGMSTQRAIRPVLVSAIIVSVIAVSNQEYIIPAFGEELARRHDDDGKQKVNYVTTRYDSRGILIHANQADRASQTILPLYAKIDRGVFGVIWYIRGQQATYIPPDHPTAPLKGGWLIREATINPPLDDESQQATEKVIWRVNDLAGFPPPYVATNPSEKMDAPPQTPENQSPTLLTPHSEIADLASFPPLPLCMSFALTNVHALLDSKLDFGRGTYFLKSSLTFQAMTRKANWYQFATSHELLESLTDPSTAGSERTDVAIFIHLRLLRPILSMALMLMSLPLVLGGYGRNMFINLGFALGNSAIFYGTLIFSQYLASFELIRPEMSAWGPLIAFGTFASLRWGQIRT